MNNLPDLAQSFQKMKLIDKIAKKLVDNRTMLSLFILKAIHDNFGTNVIIQTIKEMAQDNRKAIENLIGEDLTSEVLAL